MNMCTYVRTWNRMTENIEFSICPKCQNNTLHIQIQPHSLRKKILCEHCKSKIVFNRNWNRLKLNLVSWFHRLNYCTITETKKKQSWKMVLKALWARNSTYVLGIVISAFVLDRSIEIGAEKLWKSSNKGVSIT